MARKSPLNKLQESVIGTVKGAITHPVESAEKAVEQAKGTISLGKMVAGQVTKTAAGAVTSRLGGRGGTTSAPVRPSEEPLRAVPDTPTQPSASGAPAARKATPTPTKPPVTDVATELVKEQASQQAASGASTKPTASTTSIDAEADSSHVDATPADVAKKAAARKPAAGAKKPPAKKATTKKATTKNATTKKATAKKAAATKPASSPGAKLPVKKTAPAADADKS